MSTENVIQKLERIESLLEQQSLLAKEVLNFTEACQYLGLSQSHVYKLTSKKEIPHFCPHGKRLYFKRTELDEWLLRNRSEVQSDVDRQASDYLIGKGKTRL